MDIFEKFTPEQGKVIKLTFDFTSTPKQFKIECDEEFVGSKEIESEWRLVPFIKSYFEDNNNDL